MTIEMPKFPTGEEAVTMSREEYEDLIDTRDHAVALKSLMHRHPWHSGGSGAG